MVALLLRIGLCLGVMLSSGSAGAQDASPPAETRTPPGDVADAGAAPAASVERKASAAPKPAKAAPRPEIVALSTLASHTRALLSGTLDTSIDPATLFEQPLTDEAAIGVQAARLRAVVGRARDTAKTGEPDDHDAGAEPERRETPPAPPANVDAELWRAQLELDRARLAFYELPKTEREALLAKHAERQKADREANAKRELTRAERKADEAEEQRQRALEDARRARSEAARLVAEEHARLLGVTKRQAQFEADLIAREAALEKRREELLKVRRRVRETIQERLHGGDVARADARYDEVRAALTPARESLIEATRRLASSDLGVPGPGDDRLASLPVEIDRKVAIEARRAVEAAATRLAQREAQFRRARARQLAGEVEALNADRLALLAHVSAAKRDAVTGFGAAGLDQAAAEIRQVNVILAYHLTATTLWLAELRATKSVAGRSAVVGFIVALKWLLPLLVFVWWRRRAVRVLERWREHIRENQRKMRARVVGPSPAERAIDFTLRVRSPLEWLILLWTVAWLLPPEVQGLLEIQLLETVFLWILGGAIAVQGVDFLAGVESDRRSRRSKMYTAHLRLRSLRLISRVVVGFGLVLAITTQLVGEGTIYGWVWSLCWLAAIAVALVLVRWWRGTIFALVDLKRKATPIERWVVGSRSGWTSFPAAFVGGCLLLWRGVKRTVVGRISKLTLTRRVLAYLFSREIGKKAERDGHLVYHALEPQAHALLGPEAASTAPVPTAADVQMRELIGSMGRAAGGVYAVVGERGMGKTWLLRRLLDEAGTATIIDCPFGGLDAFERSFRAAFGGARAATLEAAAASVDAGDEHSGILIDDAHRLVLPSLGGLRSFDRLLDVARTHSRRTCWVFAFDAVVWRFVERLRGSKPLFDEVVRLEPWPEEAVARLLEDRSSAAGIAPDFSSLLPELPLDADETDLEEALERTSASYYRLIWDYAGGNPGVALHAFRSALGAVDDGSVAVRVFSPPKVSELEQLPENAVFVFRALVQLERASVADICAVTDIPSGQVGDAIRFGLMRGYIERHADGAFMVTWAWFRPITRLLERRHLAFAS